MHVQSEINPAAGQSCLIAQTYTASLAEGSWVAEAQRTYADGSERRQTYAPRPTLRAALLDIEAAVSDDTWIAPVER
jgi:hypothetical protein